MFKLNDATPISIGLVIALLGGSGWVTQIYSNGINNSAEIKEVKKMLEDKKLSDQYFKERVIEDLAKIKERFKIE